MKKVWRRRLWSKSEDELLPTQDDLTILDTQEQEKIVQSFELSHSRQTLFWRSLFSLFAVSFSAFFVYSAFAQAVSPWSKRFHVYFIEELNQSTIVIADLIEATTFALAAWGLMLSKNSGARLLWSSFAEGLALAAFWICYMYRLPRMHWHILWLPMGPSSFAALCLYVNHLLLETQKEIEKLRESIYHFKKK